MLAGSNDLILLLIGTIVVIGGIFVGFVISRKSGPPEPQNPAIDATTAAAEPPETAPAEFNDRKFPDPVSAAQPSPEAELESAQPVPATEVPEEHIDSPEPDLDASLQKLEPQLKHRIVYRFIPHLKGMLFEGDTLDGYLTDAATRAAQRGWTNHELAVAAQSGKWKKPRRGA